MPCFTTYCGTDPTRQFSVGSRFPRSSDSPIYCPTGAPLFNDRPVAVQSEMTEFRLSWRQPMINPSVDDQAAAHAAAEVEIEDWIATCASAAGRLCQGCRIGIILQNHRRRRQCAQPTAQVEIGQTFDLIRERDMSCA